MPNRQPQAAEYKPDNIAEYTKTAGPYVLLA